MLQDGRTYEAVPPIAPEADPHPSESEVLAYGDPDLLLEMAMYQAAQQRRRPRTTELPALRLREIPESLLDAALDAAARAPAVLGLVFLLLGLYGALCCRPAAAQEMPSPLAGPLKDDRPAATPPPPAVKKITRGPAAELAVLPAPPATSPPPHDPPPPPPKCPPRTKTELKDPPPVKEVTSPGTSVRIGATGTIDPPRPPPPPAPWLTDEPKQNLRPQKPPPPGADKEYGKHTGPDFGQSPPYRLQPLLAELGFDAAELLLGWGARIGVLLLLGMVVVSAVRRRRRGGRSC